MPEKAPSKPRKGRLKVFRTAIGFHDAYVAASSRKAALAAWGTDKDLFARGVAEEVTDPVLMKEPLGTPGTVFRQIRSAPADLAAPPRTRKEGSARPVRSKMPMEPAATPRPASPGNEEVEEARQAQNKARRQRDADEREMVARERELAAERRSMESRHARELEQFASRLEEAQKGYEKRLAAWQASMDGLEGKTSRGKAPKRV